MDCKFDRTEDGFTKTVSSPLFKGVMICGEDLTVAFQKKKTLYMRQSWAVGFSILELSKVLMYGLYYDNLLPTFGSGQIAVMMSDTDSFLLKLKRVKEDEAVEQISEVMDFSNYDPSHPLYDASKAKTPGLLKNEMPKCKILEVVALKPKSYALRTDKNETKTVCKGIIGPVREQIPIEAFRRCIDSPQSEEVTQHTIGVRNHVNRLIKTRRVAFTSLDDKRYQTCSIHSVPYGSGLIEAGYCVLCHTDSIY